MTTLQCRWIEEITITRNYEGQELQMSIDFPSDIESFVEHEISSGAYGSREELIVAAVTLLRQRQADLEQLRRDIAEGMEGDGLPAKQVFAELRARYGPRQTSTSP
jgi:putative addiction module CopG family antidote